MSRKKHYFEKINGVTSGLHERNSWGKGRFFATSNSKNVFAHDIAKGPKSRTGVSEFQKVWQYLKKGSYHWPETMSNLGVTIHNNPFFNIF